MQIEEVIKKNFKRYEKTLSSNACSSNEALRFNPFDEDIRTPFFRDIDRIIHSLSYTRYIDKTQVHSYQENDHISKRIVHVQLVSKIARTIGRALRLNEDLCEAIALGHDIGHTPLGHLGEHFLDEISKKELNASFAHNIQSVRNLMEIENSGKGLNLTIQVLDGIMCHNGEMVEATYYPKMKTKEEFLKLYHDSYTSLKETSKVSAMTLEGCVVRISDIIGYIGRDIEDAIDLGIIKREQLPKDIVEVLGNTNKEIVNNIILDIIKNSIDKPYIKLSDDVYKAIFKLKKFNYENIYNKAISLEEEEYYRDGMNRLYERYLNDINTKNKDSIIYRLFLNNQDDSYFKNDNKRMVIDFISGMTDELFLKEISLNSNDILTKR